MTRDEKPKRSIFQDGRSVGRSLAHLLRGDKRKKDDESLRYQGEVWSSHEKALSLLRESTEAAQKVSSLVARERELVESTISRADALPAKCSEAREKIRRTVETLDRLALVGLNAGLEGARLSESPAGKALTLVAEEVRGLATRGIEAGGHAIAGIEELERDAAEVATQASRAHGVSRDISVDCARFGVSVSGVQRAISDARVSLRELTGTDPETMKTVAEAAEHAKALVAALGALSGRVPSHLLAHTLRPVIEPLLRLVAQDSDEEDSL
ncbi:MAG: hypothetical protein U0174_14535 [Polyangiaceae bacterium]